MSIKRVNIRANDDNLSQKTYKILKDNLTANGFVYTEDDPELVIALGGDGKFLRTVRMNDFDGNKIFVGINSGTLGFLQEIEINNIKEFVDRLKNNDYKVNNLSVQETVIKTEREKDRLCTLNEILIHEENYNTARLNVYVNEDLLSRYAVDGLFIVTPVGSTAQHLNYGGAIMPHDFNALSITPQGSTSNSAFNSLKSPIIIPEGNSINIIPDGRSNNLCIRADAINHLYEDVFSIKSEIRKDKVKVLRMNDYSFYSKVHEKLLQGR